MATSKIKIYFPQIIGSDAVAYCDGRRKSKQAVTQAAQAHLLGLIKLKPSLIDSVSFCVYGHESKRLEQLEYYGNRIMLADCDGRIS